MTEGQKSILYASLVFLAVFASVAIDTGIIAQFDAIGKVFGTDGSSMLSTLTAFNGALVVGLLYGSLYSNLRHLGRYFQISAAMLVAGGALACAAGTMWVWLLAWGILGLGSGILSHVAWEFTLKGSHSALVTARMVSAQLSARPVAIALGVPAFTLMSSYRGWNLPLIVFCLAAAVASVILGILFTLARSTTPEAVTSGDSLLKHYKALKNPGLRSLVLGNFFYGMSYLGLYGVLGIALTRLYQYTPEQVGYVYGILGAVEVASAFISPALFRKLERNSLVWSFSALSLGVLVVSMGVRMNAFLFVGFLAIFVFGARQIIFASFGAVSEVIARVAPACPIGTFAIMAAWSGFSLSALVLEKAVTLFDMPGCAAILILTYLIGLFYFAKFFLFDFGAKGAR